MDKLRPEEFKASEKIIVRNTLSIVRKKLNMLYQFKIQIRGVVMPPVWRRLMVPAGLTFEQFHEVIQLSFGWKNDQPYSFSPKGKGSVPQIKAFKGSDSNEPAASSVRLSGIFSENQKLFLYTYDFTDNWEHVIHLEKIIAEECAEIELLAGKGACPVEGCGGIWGYERVKKFLKNPGDPEWHEVMWEMFGYLIEEEFDPDRFDPEVFNLKIKKYRLR